MKLDKYTYSGSKDGQVEVSDAIFNGDYKEAIVWQLINSQLGNKRQGNADTLTRGQVSGTTRKPWRQKGTGRARAGSFKSPLFRGKGIIFGPHPRSYTTRLNKKVRKQAYTSLFSLFAKDGAFKVLEDVKIEQPKTKDARSFIDSVAKDKKVYFILSSENRDLYNTQRLSFRNLKNVRVVNCKALEAKDMFYSDEIIATESAVTELNERYQ